MPEVKPAFDKFFTFYFFSGRLGRLVINAGSVDLQKLTLAFYGYLFTF
jgi:hypothetical protein